MGSSSLVVVVNDLDSLLALAHTSHSIYKLAIDLLWKNQQTLWPLVLLLPSSVIEKASLVIQKLPSWVTLCLSGTHCVAYYKLLTESPLPLLLNLTHLEVHADMELDLQLYLQLLVEGSQGLQSLTVKCCPRGIPASVLGTALGCLMAKCSMLEQVYILFPLYSTGVTSELHAPVFSNGQDYTFLKVVDILSEHEPWNTHHPRLTVSAEIVRELGRMPCLEEAGFNLVLGLDEPFETILQGFVLDNPYYRMFSTLNKLRLHAATVKHTTAILEMIGSHSIEDLTLWVDRPVSVFAFYSIAELLSPNWTDEDWLKFINIKNFKFIAEYFFSDPFNFKINVTDMVAADHAIGRWLPVLCRDDLETIPQAWKDIEELGLQWLRSGTETDTHVNCYTSRLLHVYHENPLISDFLFLYFYNASWTGLRDPIRSSFLRED
ncbi:hypothetical protein BDR06DRAFT_968139 [Suillus hirtellus]|nr:hypothetical protein BDR06DRAFT_968139 [Suillus hirtellus]